MAFATKPVPWEGEDEDGSPVVLVPLGNCELPAMVDREDWQALREAGVSPSWWLNSGKDGYAYVACCAGQPRRRFMAARLICLPRPGYVVRFADRNPLNLRWSNLRLARGTARGGELAALTAPTHEGLVSVLAELIEAP